MNEATDRGYFADAEGNDGVERRWSSLAPFNDEAAPFVAAFNAARVAMVLTNPRLPDNPIVFVNDACCALTGYSRNELIGQNCRLLQGPETDRATLAEIRAAVENVDPIQVDLLNYRKDEKTFWNRLLIVPVRGDDGGLAYYFATHTDVTAEHQQREDAVSHNESVPRLAKELIVATDELVHGNDQWQADLKEHENIETSLHQVHRMDAISQLTRVIAEDLTNRFTGIAEALELVQRRVVTGATDGLEKVTAAAIKSARQASLLTQQLFAVASRVPAAPEKIVVDTMMSDLVDPVQRILGDSVRLDVDLNGSGFVTFGDRNQLESAILNFAINARDAMPGGGRLKPSTFVVALAADDPRVTNGAVRPSDHIAISVSDTGGGMSPEIRARAFDAAFSTGLRAVPGEGTTVTLYLPRHANGAESAPDAPATRTTTTAPHHDSGVPAEGPTPHVPLLPRAASLWAISRRRWFGHRPTTDGRVR